MWGFSAGPVNAVPYVALVGGIMLLLVAAPVSLFLARVGAVVALLGSVLVLVWPLAVAVSEADASALVFAAPPVVAGGLAAKRLRGTVQTPWLVLSGGPPIWLRVLLSALPFALFLGFFNAGLVLAILLAGPPR